MSANSYMENVTSFSASLLQSLGNDTAKAAEIADMAMTDMSDNANKMGTDMERIADAYQGFAKQNYTMLDNLKLGYGGTKAEMERLLKDAQALSGVKYDINNLSDVYEAIHVIQQELDITGTTAKEASSTLTGSFNAMKAAFSNVLGNLALGRDIRPSLEALVETTVTFLRDNLLPAIVNIVTALPGALVTLVDALIPSGMQQLATSVVVKLSAFLRGALPSLLTNGVELITQLSTGFLDGIPGFLEQAGNLLTMLQSSMLAAAPSLLSSGATLILNLASGLIASVPNVIASGLSVIGQLLSTLASHLPDMLAQGIALIGQLAAGLISMIPDVITAAGDIAKKIWDTICETDWLSVGKAIIDGIVRGVKNAASALLQALKDLATQALQAAKDALGIKSPSRRFEQEVGYQIPAGEAQGIRRGMPLVRNALRSLQNLTTSEFVSDLRIGMKVQKPESGSNIGYGRSVIVNQYIYSEAKTAAELMAEARYQAEEAVLFNV